jgi:hypothetical protein
MSANNQIVIAPYPEDLEKYAVWHDGCVDNPFDFGQKPLGIFDTLEEAIGRGNAECDDPYGIVEYGVWITLRDRVAGYEMSTWEEFPDYRYLTPKYALSSSERRFK